MSAPKPKFDYDKLHRKGSDWFGPPKISNSPELRTPDSSQSSKSFDFGMDEDILRVQSPPKPIL